MQTHTAGNKLANSVNHTLFKEAGSSSSINLSLPLSVLSWDTSSRLFPPPLKCPHKPHCFQLILPSPWSRPMPKVPLAGPSSWACLGTSAAMSKYCFWPEPSLALPRENGAGNYFYLSGIDCVNTQNNASIPWSLQLQSGAATAAGEVRTHRSLSFEGGGG